MVRGRVQGVGFRASTAYEARRLGLRGWVRNRMEGHVEVVAIGDPVAVEALCGWLAQGPGGAHVTGVDVDDTPPVAELENLEGFAIR
jgi:acylphosphatase